ncbi:MAG TPA: COX15/CtaA family protein [Gemmatimonadaceae bacterium]|nr:COX15/CtaA family protein [Gemmatimonadaceae bacterium]
MNTLRRLSLLGLLVAGTHLIFGAIVRITGSGMGCGDHWPKCYGRWFPPLDRADLIIEVTHRYLAALLVLVLAALVVAAFRSRAKPGVGGRGGVLRAAGAALTLVIAAALFGGITVKLGNAPLATVGHWLIAALTIAAVATAAIRSGTLGGTRALRETASARLRRATLAAAIVGLVVVMLGGLTAKVPGASWGCLGFPLCNGQLIPSSGPQHLQMTHRLLAILLFFHMIGLSISVMRRAEAPVVRTAVHVALALITLQIIIAAVMVSTVLPPALRSVHQAIGVAIWVSLVVSAYLARIASGGSALSVRAKANPVPGTQPLAGGAVT